jgi:hypothetical protein
VNCLRCGERFNGTYGYAGSVQVYDNIAKWDVCDCGFGIAHWNNGKVQVNERGKDKEWIYAKWKTVPEGCLLVMGEI